MPHLSLLFARRYLFSKKSHSVINVISGVSAVAVAVPVMAMVILLSVFNGFEGLIKTMYRSFDPDLAIMPARGQVFATDSVPRDELLRIDGVREVSYSLDGNALLEYRGPSPPWAAREADRLTDVYRLLCASDPSFEKNAPYGPWLCGFSARVRSGRAAAFLCQEGGKPVSTASVSSAPSMRQCSTARPALPVVAR